MSEIQRVEIVGDKLRDEDPDSVVISTDKFEIGGWTSVRINAGIETCPRDFEFGATDLYPATDQRLIVAPGDACSVFIGKDRVVTGYINRHAASISDRSHAISIAGRGTCQDLVDCAALWPGQMIRSASVQAVAQKLGEKFNDGVGIKVNGVAGPPVGKADRADASSLVIPYMVVMLGETCWEVIERLCRIAGLLAYEAADGSLMLAQGPKDLETARTQVETAGTGFEEGVNVLSARLTLADDQRFSDYTTYWFSLNPFLEEGDEINVFSTRPDVGMTRYRPRALIAEVGKWMWQENAIKRANWEATRRWARGHALHLVTDSWRDGNGRLYRPFTLARLHLPTLKLREQTWMIGHVSYIKDESGTRCELELRPTEAYAVQPTLPPYVMPGELTVNR